MKYSVKEMAAMGAIGVGLLIACLVFAAGVLTFEALVMEFLWANGVAAVFPGFVASGAIPAALTFAQSFATVVLVNIVFGGAKLKLFPKEKQHAEHPIK
jgi:hypothetical protein